MIFGFKISKKTCLIVEKSRFYENRLKSSKPTTGSPRFYSPVRTQRKKITFGPVPGSTYIFWTKFEKIIGHSPILRPVLSRDKLILADFLLIYAHDPKFKNVDLTLKINKNCKNDQI